jgi:hypothetical protein
VARRWFVVVDTVAERSIGPASLTAHYFMLVANLDGGWHVLQLSWHEGGKSSQRACLNKLGPWSFGTALN